jgi:hypothetical protein
MLRHPVNLTRGPKLLIKVTNVTKPGKYTIALWCVTKGGQVDAMDLKWVTIRKRLKGWKMPAPPGLPRCFMPNMVVSTWAPRRGFQGLRAGTFPPRLGAAASRERLAVTTTTRRYWGERPANRRGGRHHRRRR